MKFTITIDSDEEDYAYNLKCFLDAKEMRSAINSLQSDIFRKIYKYKDMKPEVRDALEKVSDEIFEYFKEFLD